MAAEKNIADLLTEFLAIIGSMTSPESITPTTLEGALEDLLVSYWNKQNGITVGNTGATPTPLTIPALYSGDINPSGTQLQAIIQSILNKTNTMAGGATVVPQGEAGQFLANIGAFEQIFHAAAVVSKATLDTIKFPNDYEDGAFDNGNNWNGTRYKVPSAGYVGIFQGSTIEIELLQDVGGASTGNVIGFDILKNGAVIVSSDQCAIPTTSVKGDKFYITQKATTTATTYVAADIIEVIMWNVTSVASTDKAIFKINAGSFNTYN